MPDEFTVKDSGKMAEYPDGMRRDTSEGKPKFSLLWPEGVPYEEQLMYRVAMHYTKGGEKYGDRNYEKSCTEESLAHHIDATERHLHKFLRGVEDGEDHAAAVVWGINAVLLTRRNIREKQKQEIQKAKAEVQEFLAEEYDNWRQDWCSHECYPNAQRHQHSSTDACNACESAKGTSRPKMPCVFCGEHLCQQGEIACEGCKLFQKLTGYEKRRIDGG